MAWMSPGFDSPRVHKGGLAEWLLRGFRKAVGVILCRFESYTLRIVHMFNIFKQKKQPAGTRELANQIKVLEKELKDVAVELRDFRKEMKKAITKIGMVRFNPFNEIGGDQSFSVAFLDSEDNGVVVTSHYGREMNRVYAKTVVKGKATSLLAQEEQEAITKALEQ